MRTHYNFGPHGMTIVVRDTNRRRSAAHRITDDCGIARLNRVSGAPSCIVNSATGATASASNRPQRCHGDGAPLRRGAAIETPAAPD
jgi:hypothetical protein